jgi:hypothetical protein
VYFNIRNTLPKSGTFLLGHPVYSNDIFRDAPIWKLLRWTCHVIERTQMNLLKTKFNLN